jgi:allose kinase
VNEIAHVIVVDVGGTHVRAIRADASGTILCNASVSADRLRAEDPLEVLVELIERVRCTSDSQVDGVVIGVPGILDLPRRSVVTTPNIPTLDGLPVAELLERTLGVPVLLDHDATLQTRGEAARGSATGRNLVLGVYFGTGVGAAFLDHGRLMGGIYRMQLGHVPLRGEGRIGTGGAVDCVEAYASGAVLQSLARKYGLPVDRLFAVSPAGELGSELETFLRDQALAIATVVTLTDPEVVVIGGGVIDMEGYPFDSLIQAVRSCLSPVLGKDRIVLARAALGSTAATWGALNLLTNAEGIERSSD